MTNHALIIGINEYQRLPSLRFALQDAVLMRYFLADELGFEEVFYFTDDSPAIDAPDGSLQETQPTYSNLISFLHDFFEYSQLETGDNFWFFFSGHGMRENGQDYLIPCTGNPRLVGQTAIAISYIAERLRRSGADNVILFLDACRNENDLGDRSGAIALEQHQGTISISACSPYERSFEIEAIAQGSFTYALLESLRIRGADNCATVERLYNRLRYRVTELNQQYEKPRQVPYAVVEPAQKLHYILLPQQATEQDVLLLVSEAREAEIEGDDELAEQLWVRVLAASPANSKALKALKRIWRKGSPPTPKSGGVRNQTPKSGGEGTPNLTQIWGNNSESSPPNPQIWGSKKPQVEDGKSPEIGGFRGQSQENESPSKLSLPSFDFEVVTVNAEGKIVKKERRSANYLREDLGNGVAIDLVSIPGGSFLMGSPTGQGYDDEHPQHKVTVKPFLMGKTPITQAQWREVVTQVEIIERELDPDPSRLKGDKRPVERVSWYDALEFCVRLSKLTGREYRLPSEAEWEYGCRAGTKTPFHFGETITADLANYDGNYIFANAPKGKYREETTPIDKFAHPNAFGLYDMHGNVWELCLDPWHDNYEGAPTDGRVWDENDNDYQNLSQNLKELLRYETNACLRGGSWYINPDSCRSSLRYDDSRDNDINDIGFRVIASPVAGL